MAVEMLTIELDRSGDMLVVRLSGELDLATADGCRALLLRELRSGGLEWPVPASAVVFDVRELRFLACAGIHALREVAAVARLADVPSYLLVEPKGPIARVLAVAGPLPELAVLYEDLLPEPMPAGGPVPHCI